METEQSHQTGEESGATSQEGQTEASGATSEEVQEDQATQENSTDKDIQRYKEDMLKYKKLAKEYEAKIKSKEDEDLKKREEWKTYAQKKEEEAQTTQKELENLQNSLVQEKKYAALKSAAHKMGMRKEAIDDLEAFDFGEDVEIEYTNQGRVMIHGAEDAIKKFKTLRPYMFGGKTSHVNSETPGETTGKQVTTHDVLKAYKEARKTGDWTEAKKLQKQFVSQQ